MNGVSIVKIVERDLNLLSIKNLQKLVMKEWNKRIETQLNDETLINGKIDEIKNEILAYK